MHIKHFSFIVMAAIIIASINIPDYTFAANKTLTKTIEYKTNNQNERTNKFKKKIKLSNVTYSISDINYNVISQKPVTKTITVTTQAVSKAIKKGKKYNVKKIITKDGNTYNLVNVKKKNVIIKKGWTQKANGWKDYGSYKAAKAAAQFRIIKTTKSLNRKKISVNCKKTSIKKVNEHWKNSHINIHFISYGAESFKFKNIWIPKNTKYPMKGYEKELLKNVAGNGTKLQLKKITWNGKAYKKNGVLRRDAIAYVRKKVPAYRVTYSGRKNIKPVKGIIYTALYRSNKTIATGKNIYSIRATAVYKVANKKMPVLQLTVFAFLLLLFLTGVIFILKKRKLTPKKTQIKNLQKGVKDGSVCNKS